MIGRHVAVDGGTTHQVLGEDDFHRSLIRDLELALLDLEARVPLSIRCHTR